MRKLVRDKVPELMKAEGHTVVTGVYGKKRFRAALLDKLVEEAEEARATEGAEFRLAEELADLQEVMAAVAEEFGIPGYGIESDRAKKLSDKGGFDGRRWVDFT